MSLTRVADPASTSYVMKPAANEVAPAKFLSGFIPECSTSAATVGALDKVETTSLRHYGSVKYRSTATSKLSYTSGNPKEFRVILQQFK